MSVTAEPRLTDAARTTLARATDHLLSLQHPDGWWKGELETNVTIDAEDIFLRRYLRLPDVAETTRRSAVWIRSKQRPDGSWATFFGGPADLSTSVEAYVALRIAGDPPEAAHMRRAAAFVRDAGAGARWIGERQGADGSGGGIEPPWVWWMIALHARGYGVEHPVQQLALAGLDSFTIDDEDGRRLEACQSPVWDTALAVIALLDAGLPAAHPPLVRAGNWLAGREVKTRGDWAVRKQEL